jgi:hypothetical protein
MACTSELLFSEQLEKARDLYVDIYRNIETINCAPYLFETIPYHHPLNLIELCDSYKYQSSICIYGLSTLFEM